MQRMQALRSLMPPPHHAVDLPQDLIHLANLGLVLQEDGGVEVWDLQSEGTHVQVSVNRASMQQAA